MKLQENSRLSSLRQSRASSNGRKSKASKKSDKQKEQKKANTDEAALLPIQKLKRAIRKIRLANRFLGKNLIYHALYDTL